MGVVVEGVWWRCRCDAKVQGTMEVWGSGGGTRLRGDVRRRRGGARGGRCCGLKARRRSSRVWGAAVVGTVEVGAGWLLRWVAGLHVVQRRRRGDGHDVLEMASRERRQGEPAAAKEEEGEIVTRV